MRRGWPCELLLDDVFDGLAGGHIVYWCGLLVIHWSCAPHRVGHLVPTLSNAPDHPTMPVLAIMLLLHLTESGAALQSRSQATDSCEQ